jgi:hypothetical protein
MEDRISTNPGRVLITPEGGGASFYATISMADNPITPGTPPTKANLLTDSTATLLAIENRAVVDEALIALYNRNEWKTLASVNVTQSAQALSIALNDDLRRYKEVLIFGSTMGVNTTFSFRAYIGNDATGTFIGNTSIWGTKDYNGFYSGDCIKIVTTSNGTMFLGSGITANYNGGKPVTSVANKLYLLGYGTSTSNFVVGSKIMIIAR